LGNTRHAWGVLRCLDGASTVQLLFSLSDTSDKNVKLV